MSSSKIVTVAIADFKQTVLRKAFLIAIVAIPLAMVAIMGLVILLIVRGHEQPPLVGTVVVVDPSGDVVEAARVELDPEHLAGERTRLQDDVDEANRQMRTGAGMTLTPEQAATVRMGMGVGEVRLKIEARGELDEQGLDELKSRVRDGTYLALAIVGDDVLEIPPPHARRDERPRYELFFGEGLDSDHIDFIEDKLGDAVVRARALRAGLDPDETMAMLRRPGSETRRVLASGEETSESSGARELKQMAPMLFLVLLFAGAFTGGQHLMMSTIDEKSNRVIEVLLSAVSPFQLMAGKIIAQCGVGLLLISIYGSVVIAGLVSLAWMNYVEPMNFVYLVIYFFMAFFMLAAIMGAVGAAVTDIREANTLITPVMILVWVPWMLWMPISQAPNGGIATSFSFVPPAIPFVMIMRLAADEPVPLWQIPATIVWGYACVVAMIWAAGKIFRVGLLMYGKPPTPLQLLRWVRYA